MTGPAVAPDGGVPRLAIDPFDDAFLAAPYRHHDALRDAGPIVWLDPIGAYAMARHAEVQAALKDHALFCSGRGVGLADFAAEPPWRLPSLLLEADPPLHDRTRAIMNRVLSPQGLKALRPLWQAHAEALIDDLVARRRFDAVADLAEAYPMRIFPDAVGLPNDAGDYLLPYAAAVFNGFGPRNALFDAAQTAAAEAAVRVADACRRDNLRAGGWGMAIYESADAGLCSEEEAGRLVRSLLSAGIDTTINGIGHLILAFATHPAEWAKLRQRLELLPRAFDESLRWDSTVQTFFRTTTRAAEIGGTMIPAGTKLLLFLGAANRDPRRWDAPDRFDLDRATSGHVGFGFGIHQCVGQMIARLEAELVLAALLPRVAGIRLTGEPRRRLNNTLHAIESLPVEIVPG